VADAFKVELRMSVFREETKIIEIIYIFF